MPHSWSGKNAIVTGAASDIGAATAELLARKGMNVVLSDIQAGPLAAAAARLQELGLAVAHCQCDVSDPELVRALADFAEARFGPIHLSFNNAGVAMHGVPMHEMALADWRWVNEVNIQGVVHVIHHILPRMVRHGEPALFLNTASIGGLQVKSSLADRGLLDDQVRGRRHGRGAGERVVHHQGSRGRAVPQRGRDQSVRGAHSAGTPGRRDGTAAAGLPARCDCASRRFAGVRSAAGLAGDRGRGVLHPHRRFRPTRDRSPPPAHRAGAGTRRCLSQQRGGD